MKFSSIDEYISTFPDLTRGKLDWIRINTKRIVPDSIELISYNMPAFKLHGFILFYYAAYKGHIGFYPGNVKIFEEFKDALVSYKTSKGTIQFPISEDLPVTLIEDIIKFRVEQNIERSTFKKSRRK
jgi:uncharacterized protein YdhG (YjbR/CyaY superfamily)